MAALRCAKTGKVRYGRIGALYALVKLQSQKKVGHTERRSYFCEHCRSWHLTSRVAEWEKLR